jgi:beta-N-acetylglucosaminidase
MNKTKVALLAICTALTLSIQIKSTNDTIQMLRNANSEVLEQYRDTQELLLESEDKAKKDEEQIKALEQQIEQLKAQLKEVSMRKANYNPYDLTEKSNITVAKLESFLEGTNLKGLSSAFKKAEDVYGVNALFLVGLVANESSWGKSEKAVKYNNMTGHAVYSSLSRGSVFPSKEKSIMDTAELLATEYLKEGGEHYNGKSIWQVNVKYCLKDGKPNPEWSKTINSIASDAKSHANNN